MNIQWTVGKKLTAGFGTAFVLLLIVGSVSYRNLSLVIDNASVVANSHQMLENLESVLSLVKDVETGQRGFLLTRQLAYLEPYDVGLKELPGSIEDVRRMINDNPEQLKRLRTVEELIKERVDIIKETIALRKKDEERDDGNLQNAKGLEAALKIVLTDRGKKYMDSIRALVTDMEKEEKELLKKRSKEEESNVQATKWTIVLGTLAAALIMLTVGYLITRGITIPLTELTEKARQIAAGNLKVPRTAVISSDEVGQLAGAFNTMLDGLQDLTRQTVAVTSNLGAASSQIMASTQEQAASTKQQAASVQEITTTMEEINQSGLQIGQKAKQVAAAAEATSAGSASGLQAVLETNRTMSAIREQVEQVAENIISLSEKTQAVGEIIATVNDVAERSNLLALNAAIEAASAGEHGNRFSVVANEMKNLADQAKDSTIQVRTILSDIQKGINTSVMLTEEGVKRVEAGKQQADVAEQTIRQLAKTTLESVQAFEQIIGAGNQQQIGFEQVSQGMKDIRQAATQTAATTSQLEKAVLNLNTLSQELKRAVGRYQV